MIEPVYIFILSLFFWLISEAYVNFFKNDQDGVVDDQGSSQTLITTAMVLLSLTIGIVILGTMIYIPGSIKHNGYLILGFLITLAGIIYRQYSIFVLREYFSGYVRVKEHHALIQNGPYKTFRHPSYFGSLICFVGLGLTSGHVAPLIIMPISMIIIYNFRIKVEEELLESKFGQAYKNYKKSTWGYLPFVK
ncbi:isoprenylcysteine carboxylmethyltransferase family protein [Bacillus timonensis]|nr:isoprenylcysteine carboxylmethyltransferase family protein [Bacillus timonensis]